MSELGEQANKDFKKMEVHRGGNKSRVLQGKIERGTANPMQVRSWYLIQDPLEEDALRSWLSSDSSERIKNTGNSLKKAYLLEKGAGLIITNMPQVYDEKEGSPNMVDKFRNLSYEDYLCLFTSTEMLWEAALILDVAGVSPFVQHYVLPGHEHLPEYQNLLARAKRDVNDSVKFAVNVASIILSDMDIAKRDPRITLLALEEAIKFIARIDNQDLKEDRDVQVEGRSKNLMMMIGLLQEIFLDPTNLLTNESLPKSRKKGKLYELIWLLDAFMLLTSKGDFDTTPVPAMEHEDMPEIGYPSLRRSADVILRNPKKGIELRVQLKAYANKDKAPYFPSIRIASDPDFKEADPKSGRLVKKLEFYKKYIELGFDPNLEPEFRKYVLPSVLENLDSGLPETNELLEMAGVYDLKIDPLQVVADFQKLRSLLRDRSH